MQIRDCRLIGYSHGFPARKKLLIMNELSAKDEELIEMAYSTTYRSSIRKMMNECESERAKAILKRIMENPDMEWED